MKNRLETVIAKIGKTMQGHLANQEFDSVANMSTLLSRACQLQKQYEKNEQELAQIEEIEKGANHKNRIGHASGSEWHTTDSLHLNKERATPQTIRIRINWKANKINKDTEEIYFPKATDVMTEFAARLIEELGKEAHEKLFDIRANRGPLLSRFPKKDFGGYQHKHIRGTDCFILTHSSTIEKVELLNRISRDLGLVPGSVEIKAEDRF